MSQLKVSTWNAEGMFVEGTKTRRATPHDALAALRRLDSDIVVVPEFGRLTELDEQVRQALGALGYELTLMAYDEPRAPGLGFAILSRLKLLNTQVHDLGTSKRQLLEVCCESEEGEPIRILGAHLDDRSEEGRLGEIAAVADIVNEDPDIPTLLLGDFNAMRRESLFAIMARSSIAQSLSEHVQHELVRSMADRVGEMALGTTIEYLETHTELHDLDPGKKRTISGKQAGLEWVPAWRLAKIDWIFGSKHFTTSSYHVLPDVGSDHRPVVAMLDIVA